MQNLKCEREEVTGFKLTQLVIRKKMARSFDLKPSTILVLMGLVDCYNQKNGIVFPSIAYLQDCLNIKSESTVILAIKELVSKRLIIKSKAKAKKSNYSHSVYSFTNIFFDFIFSEEEPKLPMILQETTYEILDKPPMNFIGKKKREKIKENNNFSLTNFQMKYQDVFSKLSTNDLEKYKLLKGYEKEEWLRCKRKEYAQRKSSIELLDNLEHQKTNKGCPLDFSKEDQIKWFNDLPMIAKNSYFAREIKSRWGLK